jgi:hypothetical protein
MMIVDITPPKIIPKIKLVKTLLVLLAGRRGGFENVS